eukprot:6204408-Pleurochrysis_carterae.AAC.2
MFNACFRCRLVSRAPYMLAGWLHAGHFKCMLIAMHCMLVVSRCTQFEPFHACSSTSIVYCIFISTRTHALAGCCVSSLQLRAELAR